MDIRAALAITVTLSGPALCAVARDTWQNLATARGHQMVAPRTASEPMPTADSTSGWSSLPVPLIEEPPPPVQDIYGNQISDAVARYRFDATGSTYEEHSPRTEMPKPLPPTS